MRFPPTAFGKSVALFEYLDCLVADIRSQTGFLGQAIPLGDWDIDAFSILDKYLVHPSVFETGNDTANVSFCFRARLID